MERNGRRETEGGVKAEEEWKAGDGRGSLNGREEWRRGDGVREGIYVESCKVAGGRITKREKVQHGGGVLRGKSKTRIGKAGMWGGMEE